MDANSAERYEMITKVCMAFEAWWHDHPELSFVSATKKWANRRKRKP